MGNLKVKKFIFGVFLSCVSSLFLNAQEINTYVKKIIVVNHDPYLKTQGMKMSEYERKSWSSSDMDLAVSELVDDIETSSHGLVKCEIVEVIEINDFPKYMEPITLLNGQKSYRFDEETWLDYMKDGWYGSLSKDFKISGFDYEDMYESLDLINRKNIKNDFDEIWLTGGWPNPIHESNMVGRTAYWINAPETYKDCDNFKVMCVSIERRDANYECQGHAAENILKRVFRSSYDAYAENYVPKSLDSLNLWEKFVLNEHAVPGHASVGNVHFAPNSERDYDWANTKYVESSWIDWLDYPNLTGKTKLSNCNDWLPQTSGMNFSCRSHHVWWFGMMPHVAGRTKDGFSNNWWDYLSTLDYVTKLEPAETTQKHNKGTYFSLPFKATYQSEKMKLINFSTIYDCDLNYYISDESVVTVKNKSLYACGEGSCTITYYLDGMSATYKVEIGSDVGNESVQENKVWSDGGTLYLYSMQNVMVSIFNINGQLVRKSDMSLGEYKVISGLKQGFYIVCFGKDSSKKIFIR